MRPHNWMPTGGNFTFYWPHTKGCRRLCFYRYLLVHQQDGGSQMRLWLRWRGCPEWGSHWGWSLKWGSDQGRGLYGREGPCKGSRCLVQKAAAPDSGGGRVRTHYAFCSHPERLSFCGNSFDSLDANIVIKCINRSMIAQSNCQLTMEIIRENKEI